MTNFNERWGWYKLNGIYYVYDRELGCLPSCMTEEYFEATKLEPMERFLSQLNRKESKD